MLLSASLDANKVHRFGLPARPVFQSKLRNGTSPRTPVQETTARKHGQRIMPRLKSRGGAIRVMRGGRLRSQRCAAVRMRMPARTTDGVDTATSRGIKARSLVTNWL